MHIYICVLHLLVWIINRNLCWFYKSCISLMHEMSTTYVKTNSLNRAGLFLTSVCSSFVLRVWVFCYVNLFVFIKFRKDISQAFFYSCGCYLRWGFITDMSIWKTWEGIRLSCRSIVFCLDFQTMDKALKSYICSYDTSTLLPGAGAA